MSLPYRLSLVDVVTELPADLADGAPRTPLIIRGADALRKVTGWTIRHVAESYERHGVQAWAPAAGGGTRFGPGIDSERVSLRADEIVERVTAGTGADVVYFPQVSLLKEIAELADDVELPSAIPAQRISDLNLWMGSKDYTTQLHFDMAQNLYVQIEGRKRFLLFRPEDFGRIQTGLRGGMHNASAIDPEAPDLEAFPEFAGLDAWEAVLEPGDLLYLPPFWWHQVSGLQGGVSLSIWWRPAVEDHATAPALLHHLRAGTLGGGGIGALLKVFDFTGLSGTDASATALLDLARHLNERGHHAAAAGLGAAVVRAALDTDNFTAPDERTVRRWLAPAGGGEVTQADVASALDELTDPHWTTAFHAAFGRFLVAA
ncbi:cupin-like domain-containing protein [Streptomyces sp. WI04-05B]|uniref:cupin-like domain-containing protein n=1 Tax=Streptomyces TaxID=1883 RepID=UPI0029B414F2|nr:MULTISPECIES: cupin-like domain-containing protein [unclassified Streptomyces]MDX2547094.1 cupin-like domain-containing protein [Streptomyces sp. WI04-05B]MDX2589783.1 cupin-like domain-containing protein [Streptomyces sp. WI04-05A]MDX3753233.1 cupin-like domain-containing protein [Streptomyces sp. AK08-02]